MPDDLVQISIIDGQPQNIPEDNPIARVTIPAPRPWVPRDRDLPPCRVYIYQKGKAEDGDLELVVVAKYDMRGATRMPDPKTTKHDIAIWFENLAKSFKVLTGWVKPKKEK